MDTTAYITAGGNSRRFKQDKSLYPYRGKALIQHVYDTLGALFPKVCIVANDCDKYNFLGADVVPDLVQGIGPMGGLYTALAHARSERIFFCGCDMPNLTRDLISFMVGLAADYDVVVPVVPKGYDPLHAIYSKQCLPFIKDSIAAGDKKIRGFFHRVRLREVSVDEMRQFGDWEHMLFNINYRHDAAPPGSGG
jgi:molybdopterin-guanine dinucleotide biosynthesis protein A